MILDAFTKALRQLSDGRVLGILLLALIITVTVTGPFLLALVAVAWVIDWLPGPSTWLPWVASSEDSSSWVSWSSWLFWTYVMSPLAVAIIGALLEPIVEAVEARHYPGLPKVKRRGLGVVIGYAIRFLGLMLGISILAALIAWLTPIPAALAFTLATGYLIAREYFETVALRRMELPAAKATLRGNLGPLWLVGCLIALALNLPLINVVAPLVGVAAFTHLFHHMSRP